MKFYLKLFLVLFGLNASAQVLTVEKIKGKRAIVVIESGKIKPGQTLRVGGKSSSQNASESASRDMRLSIESAILSSSDSGTSIGLIGDIGFNKGAYEFGPVFGFSNNSKTTASSYSFGGFFDFNFRENNGEETFVPYAAAGVVLNSINENNKTKTTTNLTAAIGAKMFYLSSAWALDASVLAYSSSVDSKTTTTFGIGLGVLTYF